MASIFSSAISVSLDVGLRKTIRKSVTDHSKLLDSIGTAQMQQELQSRVLAVTRKTSYKMGQEIGVEASMTEEDMKRYVNEVLKEIRTTRSNH